MTAAMGIATTEAVEANMVALRAAWAEDQRVEKAGAAAAWPPHLCTAAAEAAAACEPPPADPSALWFVSLVIYYKLASGLVMQKKTWACPPRAESVQGVRAPPQTAVALCQPPLVVSGQEGLRGRLRCAVAAVAVAATLPACGSTTCQVAGLSPLAGQASHRTRRPCRRAAGEQRGGHIGEPRRQGAGHHRAGRGWWDWPAHVRRPFYSPVSLPRPGRGVAFATPPGVTPAAGARTAQAQLWQAPQRYAGGTSTRRGGAARRCMEAQRSGRGALPPRTRATPTRGRCAAADWWPNRRDSGRAAPWRLRQTRRSGAVGGDTPRGRSAGCGGGHGRASGLAATDCWARRGAARRGAAPCHAGRPFPSLSPL